MLIVLDHLLLPVLLGTGACYRGANVAVHHPFDVSLFHLGHWYYLPQQLDPQ